MSLFIDFQSEPIWQLKEDAENAGAQLHADKEASAGDALKVEDAGAEDGDEDGGGN